VSRPPACLAVRHRFRGPSVHLYEWGCAGHAGAHPDEEWTDAHEVVVPRRGAFQWDIRGERVLGHPGVATFLNPEDGYRVRHPVPGGDAGAVFQITTAELRTLLAEHDPPAACRDRPRFPVSHAPLDGRAYLLHHLAMRAASDPAASAIEVEERSAAFLRAALAQAFRPRPAPARNTAAVRRGRAAEYAARVAEVVAVRYREPLSLADLGRMVGVSPFHLSRLVTAATGVPIYRMILRRRLRAALEMLLETRESITRVALEHGFASHSHFTDAFRCEFGVPPSRVRSRKQ
jgi:AraC-like DNA-binding protein